jgi:hypothetical protein
MADEQRSYWDVLNAVWNDINIYDGAEVFLNDLGKTTRAQAMLFCSHFCQSEICNGGFGQFFSNSTGVLAPEAVEGFNAIGMPKCAAIVSEAMILFGTQYPRERETRAARLDSLAVEAFEAYDDRFYAQISTENGGFDAAATRYAYETPPN